MRLFPASPEVSPPMPNEILQTSMWANTQFPQTITGLFLCVGNKVTEAAIEREVDHETVSRSVVTPEQTDRLLKLVATMHKKYDISCQLQDAQVGGTANSYTADTLTDQVHTTIAGVVTATAEYAQAVLPRTKSLWESPLLLSSKNDDRVAAENRLVRRLFKRSLVGGKLRPEAVALGMMWKAGAASLKSDQGRHISNEYRDHLRLLSAPDVSGEAWKISSDTIFYCSRVLREIVHDNINSSMPDIAEQCNVAIAPEVVETFVDNTTDAIRISRMPYHLYRYS